MWWKRLWAVLSAYSTLSSLWALVVASGATTWAISKMPSGWYAPQYWFAALFIFTSASATILSVVAAAGRVRAAWTRYRHPPRLTLVADGGTRATLRLNHSGAPTVYSAEGRIVSVLAHSPNPAPQAFRCRIRAFGAGAGTEALTLEDGGWGEIQLAAVRLSQMTLEAGLEITRGSEGCRVTEEGAIVEVQVRARPPLSIPCHRYQLALYDFTGPAAVVLKEIPLG